MIWSTCKGQRDVLDVPSQVRRVGEERPVMLSPVGAELVEWSVGRVLVGAADGLDHVVRSLPLVVVGNEPAALHRGCRSGKPCLGEHE